jgi:hypothetical protein
MRRRLFIRAILLAAATGGTSRAADIANGQRIFETVCQSCHGPANLNFRNIVTTGANNPDAILRAWTRPGSVMNGLETLYGAAQRADIAAYLGLFLPPSGEIRASAAQLDFGAQPLDVRSAVRTVTVSNFNGTVTIATVASNNAAEFPIVADTCTGSTLGPAQACTLDIAFQPAALGPRGATVAISNTGVVNPVSFTAIGTGDNAPAAANYQGLWWGGPAEDGWGINLAHQGDVIYMTWYTYDATGRPSWLALVASRTAPGTYAGPILEVRGSPYDVTPYNPALKVSQTVGSGTLAFADASNGTLAFTAKSVSRTIAITRLPLGAQPTCVATASPNFAAATNYQDIWWNPAEDGWGINFAHNGNTIYATWYTYDSDGSPLWLAALMSPGATPGTWSGAVWRVTGAPFGATYDPARKVVSTVGSATLAFADGNSATWSYTVNNRSGQKAITRFPFASPPTLCR